MSYLDRVLQPGEVVRYRGTVHWIAYIPALVFAAIGVAGGLLAMSHPDIRVPGMTVAAVGAVLATFTFLRAWIRRLSTEIAVTDRRVIFKHGLFARRSVEMHMDKVESVDVTQSILGRILDYGDVTVHGTGADQEPLRRVPAPLTFRNAITAR